jgi:hypothetical protein
MLLTPIFLFFWPYKASEGVSISGGGFLFQDLRYIKPEQKYTDNINISVE